MDAEPGRPDERGSVVDRMRKGWRVVINIHALFVALAGVFPSVALARGPEPAPNSPDRPVRLTVEISWANPAGDAAAASGTEEVELEVTEGQVVGAISLPSATDETVSDPQKTAAGAWRLGPRRGGRVRVRVEAPVTASLVLRTGGAPMRFPLSAVLDGAPKMPQSPLGITIERVPWDVVDVDLGPDAGPSKDDGIVAPGARVPIAVAFRVLTPEPGEAALRCIVELRPARGGAPVWRYEIKGNVPTNSATPPTFMLPLDTPKDEGTYVLDLRATWEQAQAHDNGKILKRLINRGRRGIFGPASANRRVTLAVLSPEATRPKDAATLKAAQETEVDAVDLVRPRGHRAWGSGRAPKSGGGHEGWEVPEEALAQASTRDRIKGLIGRAPAEAAKLGPVDAAGYSWSSVGLRVTHPGKPHKLTLTVTGGDPTALGVALLGGPGALGSRPRVLLDTVASGPPILPTGPASVFSFNTWPDASEPVLVLVNRGTGSPVQVGSVTLSELSDLPPAPAIEAPTSVATRTLGVYLDGTEALDRFGGGLDGGLADPLAAAKHFVTYLTSCGASAAIVPERLADRGRRRALDGTAAEDSTGPDRLDLVLRVLARKGVAPWIELDSEAPLPGLPAQNTAEALAAGLVRVDRKGEPDGTSPAYHPLAEAVADAWKKRVAAAAAPRRGDVKPAGLLIHLGPGATLLGSPDTGFDDATFARFVREAFDPSTAKSIPGTSTDDTDRYSARAKFVAGPGRMPWLAWRSKRIASLYADLAAAAREAAPGARLAVATPGPDDGPAGVEARKADLAGLAPALAWRAVGLDLEAWPTGENAPIVLRGVDLGPDDLAHDLATNPELDAKVAACGARGLLLDLGSSGGSHGNIPASSVCLRSTGLDSGPNGDEPLGHALAALDAQWVWVASGALSGHEERVRKFARVFRAIPATAPAERQPLAFGAAVRAHPGGDATYLALSNDTPYPVRLDTVLKDPGNPPVSDIGRGLILKPGADASGRHLVLDLPPFGISAIRVGSTATRIASVTPYPSEAVLTSLHARYEAISAQLTRLNRGADRENGRSGPPNPGFEPETPQETALRLPPMPNDPMPAPKGDTDALVGWHLATGNNSTLHLDADQPHTGKGSMRLEAPIPPAVAVSEPFMPGIHSALVVRAWFRSEKPDARVRVWIDGESGGKPYRRISELVAQPGWAERAVRAGDVPPAGLDSLRLRFELLSPGSVWVDDLTVTGETLSEPERRNARNALVAALQAYNEKRYADFARLSGSRWTRHPGAAPAEGTPDRVASERSGLLRTGDASALPPARRLR